MDFIDKKCVYKEGELESCKGQASLWKSALVQQSLRVSSFTNGKWYTAPIKAQE